MKALLEIPFSVGVGRGVWIEGDSDARLNQLTLINQAPLTVVTCDVRVIQRSEYPGFALETTEPLLVIREVLGQDLDRSLTIETRVFGRVDLPHRPGAQGAESFVVSEGLARRGAAKRKR